MRQSFDQRDKLWIRSVLFGIHSQSRTSHSVRRRFIPRPRWSLFGADPVPHWLMPIFALPWHAMRVVAPETMGH